MANYTTNLELEKPLETEAYDIKVFNRNMDKIDEEFIKKLNINAKATTEEALAGINDSKYITSYSLSAVLGNLVSQMQSAIENLLLEKDKEKYHVGKIVMETENINPSTYLGFGTWVLWGSGRVPIGVDPDDADFNEVEKTGGEKTHTHKYGLQYGEYYSDLSIKSNSNAGLLNYTSDKDYSLANNSNNIGNHTALINSGNQEGAKSQSMWHYRIIANTSHSESREPYITCYMWKRIA